MSFENIGSGYSLGSSDSFQQYQEPYSPPPSTPRKSLGRTNDLLHNHDLPSKKPKVKEVFTDDQPFLHRVQLVQQKSLVLDCVAGLTQNNIDGQTQEFDGLVRLHAPCSDVADEMLADFIVLADVSASMMGEKIDQLKETMNWLIDNLGENHRMCVISFNDEAVRKTPLTVMSAAGKIRQLEVVRELRAVASTDITAALKLAADVVNGRTYKDVASVVLLLTDGCDTSESTEQDRTQAVASIASKALLACVGIGEDHDAMLLSRISRQANGRFQYCPDAQAIAPTIGGIKGAVTSVCALGLRLIIEAQAEPLVHEIGLLSTGQTQLFPFRASMLQTTYVKASVAYEIPGNTNKTTVMLEARLPEVRVAADSETLISIDAQKNRELAGNALVQAADLAAENNLDEAKGLLEEVINVIEQSISAHDALCIQLIADCRQALENIQKDNYSLAEVFAAGSNHSQQAPSASMGDLYSTPFISFTSASAKKSSRN